MDKPVISVVVCTYNRVNLITGCLESLVCQAFDSFLYEVIVVDNNSTDATWSIAADFAKKHPNIRIVKEANQGLSHARNRGWRDAEGDYIAYIDDDALAYPDWLSQMYAFTERHPDVSAFGGPYDALSMVPLPDWLPSDHNQWSLGDIERPVKVGTEWINGTNMVFKKDILSELGGFDVNLGMSGKKVSYGEETRLLLDIKNKNRTVFYVPDMKVRHLIAEYKMSLNWLLKACYSVGRCSSMTFNRRRSLVTQLACLGLSIMHAVKKLLLFRRIPFKWRIYLVCAPLYSEWGALADYLSSYNKRNEL